MPVVRVLVADCDSSGNDQPFPQAGTLAGDTGYNVSDKQVGMVSRDFAGTEPYGDFVATANDTVAAQDAIEVVQGTPVSSDYTKHDEWEVNDKALVKSGVLKNGQVRSVKIASPRPGRASAATLTNIAAPANDSEYRVYVTTRSTRNDRDYGDNDEVVDLSYETDGTATLAELVNSFVEQGVGFSRYGKGNKDFVVLGIDIDGAGAGTAIGGLASGDSVTYATVDGRAYSLPIDESIVYALATAIEDQADLSTASPLTATSEIVNVTPGTTTNADAIVVIGLAHELAAYDDDIPETQPRVFLTPADKFTEDATLENHLVMPIEPINSGRMLSIWNANRNQLNVHTSQIHPFGEKFSEGFNYIDKDVWYTTYIVDHFGVEQVLSGGDRITEQQLVCLIPTAVSNDDVSTVATAVGADLGGTPTEPFTTTILGDCSGTVSGDTASGFADLSDWLESAGAKIEDDIANTTGLA
jgi:hypothetical protein